MLIWGNTDKVIHTDTIDVSCAECGCSELLAFTMQKFFTLFYVPTIPLRKTLVYICPECSEPYDPKLINNSSIAIGKKSVRTPIWGFSGLAVIAVFVAIGAWMDYEDSEKTAVCMESPQVGDRLVFKDEDGSVTPYGFMKIKSMDGDSITLSCGNFIYSRKDKAVKKSKSAKEHDFLEEEIVVSKEQFKNLGVVHIERVSE